MKAKQTTSLLLYISCSCILFLVHVRTFCMALEGLGAQMCDTMTLEVLCPREGFSTTLLCTDKASVIIMFPDEHKERHCGQ